MFRFGQHPMVYSIAVLMAAGMLGECGFVIAGWREAKTTALVVAQKKQEWRRWAALRPPPTEMQSQRNARDLDQAEAELAAWCAQLHPADTAADDAKRTPLPVPTTPTEAFFALTAFKRNVYEQAAKVGTQLSDDAHLGFSAYAQEGPTGGLIPGIERQRRLLAPLIVSLLNARPTQLLEVQREELSPLAPDGHTHASAAADTADFFIPDPRTSIRRPEMIDTTAFRLTFIGSTAVLRRFLNQLAQQHSLAVVRNVEVEPGEKVRLHRSHATGDEGPLTLVARPMPSRFSVTVEVCEVAWPKAAGVDPVSSAAEASTAPVSWEEPPVQRRGADWRYDVFTPPSLYYDQQTRALRAIAEATTTPSESVGATADLELREVHPGLYRLQLAGYAGGADGLRGIFLSPDSGEIVIAREGQQLAGYDLTVKRLGIERQPGGSFADGVTHDVAAFAVLAEESGSGEILLTTREPCRRGALLGLFTSRRRADFRRELREGESVALNGVSYCVEHLLRWPPQAVVACLADGQSRPVLRTLTASTSEAAAPPAGVLPDKRR